MKICEVCKKEENDWKKTGTYPFMFVYTVKCDDEEHFICPECTLKRIEEIARNKDEEGRSGID